MGRLGLTCTTRFLILLWKRRPVTIGCVTESWSIATHVIPTCKSEWVSETSFHRWQNPFLILMFFTDNRTHFYFSLSNPLCWERERDGDAVTDPKRNPQQSQLSIYCYNSRLSPKGTHDNLNCNILYNSRLCWPQRCWNEDKQLTIGSALCQKGLDFTQHTINNRDKWEKAPHSCAYMRARVCIYIYINNRLLFPKIMFRLCHENPTNSKSMESNPSSLMVILTNNIPSLLK